MVNIKNINNTKVSHLFVAFCPSLQSLSSLSSFSSEQKSIKNLRPHFLTFFMKQALMLAPAKNQDLKPQNYSFSHFY